MNIHSRLLEGLKTYNITENELQYFKYAGGDHGSHLKYAQLIKLEKPLHKTHCICGHPIKNNCYIKYNDQIIVLGNCCIKRFIPKEQQGRTCEECGNPHKNRKSNLCTECKDFIEYPYYCRWHDCNLKKEYCSRCNYIGEDTSWITKKFKK